MFVDAAAIDDLADARPHVVKAGGRQIVLILWEGEVFALRNICPHQSQAFDAGFVRPQVGSGTVGCIDDAFDPASGSLLCPWHRWQFDLATGTCLADPSYRIRSYETRIEEGRILVDVGRARPGG
jgi:nitrite reductase/ring-hydroxylating ferredoxin subunit